MDIGTQLAHFINMNDSTLSVAAPNLTKPVGCVMLVGAGPGDPELLTLKAVKAIQQANVILVDDLVSDDILRHASPDARVIYVGKRGGCASTPQRLILKMMVQEARHGQTVVRLKGGDPFIFGRGGEEFAYLEAAGIPVTTVNGITAGLAAATSISASLTHRDMAHGVIFMTGHSKPDEQSVDWSQIAATCHRSKLTLVIYMGVSNVGSITTGLMQGLPAHTPVAVIQNASLPTQREVGCELKDLADTFLREGLASPAIMIIGNVTAGLKALRQPESNRPIRVA